MVFLCRQPNPILLLPFHFPFIFLFFPSSHLSYQQITTRFNRIISQRHVPCTSHGLSVKAPQTVRQTSCHKDLALGRIEPRTHTNKRRTGPTMAVADRRCLHGELSIRNEQNQVEHKIASQLPLSIHGPPKRLKGLGQDLGEM
jgi:hypothetical protein